MVPASDNGRLRGYATRAWKKRPKNSIEWEWFIYQEGSNKITVHRFHRRRLPE